MVLLNVFRVSGSFKMGRESQAFTVEVAGDDQDSARERVYSVLGSRHRVKRRRIDIESVDEIAPDEVTDPVLQHKLGVTDNA